MEKSMNVLDTAIRNQFFNSIVKFVTENYDTDVLTVAANEISIPTVDEDGNEKFVNIKISVPRGTRRGRGMGYDPYDGYAAAEEYKVALAMTAEKEKQKEEKRKKREAEKAQNNKTLTAA